MKTVNDILEIKEDSLAVETIALKINSLRNVNIEKKGARVFRDGKIYSSSVVGEKSTEALIEETEKNSLVGIDYEYELPKNAEFSYEAPEFNKISKEDFVKEIQSFEEELKPYADKFVFTGKHTLSHNEVIFESSNQVKSVVKNTKIEMSYIFKKMGSPNLIDGYFISVGTKNKMHNVFKEFKPFLDKYDTLVDLVNGEYPILIADSEGSYFHKLFESFMPNKYFEGTAIYSGKLGKKIFHEDFTLIDYSYLPEYGIVRTIDHEGVKREKADLVLIENGVFKNIISDLRHAKKYNIKSTGNGLRSFDSSVNVSFNNPLMKPGKREAKEILKGMDRCIVAIMAFGGDFTDNGEYSTPVHLGFLVENGEIKGRIPQITITTSIQKMFNENFIEVASGDLLKSTPAPSFFHKVNVINN